MTNILQEFADHLLLNGLTVYLNGDPSYNYGFYTDDSRTRVVYFQLDYLGNINLSGCYHAHREGGTGWRMNVNDPWEADHAALLYAHAPRWATIDPRYIDADTYLKSNSHAQYQQYRGDACTLYTLDGELPARCLKTGENRYTVVSDSGTYRMPINGGTRDRNFSQEDVPLFYAC